MQVSPLFRVLAITASLSAAVSMSGCTEYVSAYEAHVYDWEPVYCYQTVGRADCYAEPAYRDRRRLVNYFGPAPQRYDPPETVEVRLDPPPPVFWFVRDPEPILGRPALFGATMFQTELPAGPMATTLPSIGNEPANQPNRVDTK